MALTWFSGFGAQDETELLAKQASFAADGIGPDGAVETGGGAVLIAPGPGAPSWVRIPKTLGAAGAAWADMGTGTVGLTMRRVTATVGGDGFCGVFKLGAGAIGTDIVAGVDFSDSAIRVTDAAGAKLYTYPFDGVGAVYYWQFAWMFGAGGVKWALRLNQRLVKEEDADFEGEVSSIVLGHKLADDAVTQWLLDSAWLADEYAEWHDRAYVASALPDSMYEDDWVALPEPT